MDAYSKTILTIIAVSLALIAGHQVNISANAQMGGCGESAKRPCYISYPPGREACGNSAGSPCYVQVIR